MLGFARALWRLYQVYGRRRLDGLPSTAAFWYLAEPPRVIDPVAFQAYLASARPSPLYLIDYRPKLAYDLVNEERIIELNYGPPIGRQINPEAAFQVALGLHDRHRLEGRPADLEAFLRYARYFLRQQDDRGRWPYRFPWSRAPDPWHSALAQSRGVSVMLRAWMVTGDPAFGRAARSGIGDFSTPIDRGGFRATHALTGVSYLEEYPFDPSAAINGALAALFGLFECGHWLDDPRARELFAEYADAALTMLPAYTLRWWSLYDFDPESPIINVHSPRYHRMVIGYLRILATISGRPGFAAVADRWHRQDRWPARLTASALKVVKKTLHR